MWAVAIMHGQNTASINQLHLQGPKNSFNPKRLPVSHKSDRHSLEHQPNSHNTYTDFTYHPAKFYLVAQVSLYNSFPFPCGHTHVCSMFMGGGTLAFGKQCADGTPDCAIHLCFFSENSWMWGWRDAQGVTLSRARGCLSGCIEHWQQAHSPTRCVRWQLELGGTALCRWACGWLAMVAVQPWLPCCQRSCADSSLLPWNSLMREGQMGPLGIE